MESMELNKKEKASLLTGVVGAAALAWALTRFKVAAPNEILIKTGFGVKQQLHLSRSTVAWPLQRVVPMNVAPFTVAVNINGMSTERIPFRLPIVVTVGPNTTDNSALQLFAEKLSQKEATEVHHLVRDIIAGQSRIITASLTADQLFHEREVFKKQVADGVELSLSGLGLKVYNANLEELADEKDCSYFEEQRKRSLSNVHAEATVSVALAETKGAIGAKEQESQRRVQTAALEMQAKLQENNRELEVAKSVADLAIAKAELDRQAAIAAAESKAATEQRTLDLQQAVERMRANQETERLRAEELTWKVVEAEKLLRETSGLTEAKRMQAENAAQVKQLESDAQLYAQRQQALGRIELGKAEAESVRIMLVSEAAGIRAKLEAEAEGLERLVGAAGGPSDYLLQQMIKSRTLPEIAEAQATALRDMKPVVYHNQAGAGQGVIQALAADMPPYLEGLKHMTGLDVMGLLKKRINPEQPTPQ